MVRERERQRGDLKHLSVHQWLRSAIPDSQQPTSPIGFLFLKLPPPPCAVLLVAYYLRLPLPADLVCTPSMFQSELTVQCNIRSLR